MGLIRALKSRLKAMKFMPDPPAQAPEERTGGIALFMVLGAVAMLSVLVTEFVYVSNINQKLAFDGLDQLKAHYLAKSGLKLSLLRLKAYQNVKGVLSQITGGAGGGAGGAAAGVPKAALEGIWNFPIMYPFPTDIPGLTAGDKDAIAQFEKASGLDGAFSASIGSESAQYNLNMLLASSFAPSPTGPSGASGPSGAQTPPPAPNSTPTPPAGVSGPSGFSKDNAAKALQAYLAQILMNKFQDDQDFAEEYREFQMEDFMDNLRGWVDWEYQRHQDTGDIPMKQGPFYSLSELHMVPLMDDGLYDLFAPALTVSTTPGIDIDTMKAPTLRALVPGMTQDEVDAFFKFRDSTEEDNSFKNADDFYKYLQDNVAIFHQDPAEIQRFKKQLADQHITLVVDETEFKITVRAQVNESVKVLEAWVHLGGQGTPSSTGTNPAQPNAPKQPTPPPGTPPLSGPGPQPQPDPGLKITFMRIL